MEGLYLSLGWKGSFSDLVLFSWSVVTGSKSDWVGYGTETGFKTYFLGQRVGHPGSMVTTFPFLSLYCVIPSETAQAPDIKPKSFIFYFWDISRLNPLSLFAPLVSVSGHVGVTWPWKFISLPFKLGTYRSASQNAKVKMLKMGIGTRGEGRLKPKGRLNKRLMH